MMDSHRSETIRALRGAYETGGIELEGKYDYARTVFGAIRLSAPYGRVHWLRGYFLYDDLFLAIGKEAIEHLLLLERQKEQRC